VIYANQYIDSLFAAATRRFLGAPFVCHLRLPPPDAWCTQFRIGMSQAQHLIATSEQTRREWLASGFVGSPISVVPNGIDPSRYRRRDSRDALRRQLGVTPGRLLITYAGRLHPAKGVEVLIEAAAQLARQRAIHLVVAGRPGALQTPDGGPRDYPRELRAVAERVGIASAVTWIDHYRDVAALFSATDVAAVPSVWSEPFGRVAIESMACETPVVASRTGGIPEILTGEFADWMCEPGRAEALADRIACVADRHSADPGLGLRARAHVVRHFPIERTVDGIDRLLTSVARSGEPVAAAAASSSTS
jgi:glycosyltransferase involved in cell wall biosynthesis